MVLNDNVMIPATKRIRQIHFVGVGGAGMSGIAEVLLNLGYQVSGSDIAQTAVTQRLIQLGATIYFSHAPQNIQNADVVVLSSVIRENNPEWAAAREARLPIVHRAEMLAELMRFRYGIAIAGTHGKTTTTSLVTSVLTEANLDPTFVIGGILNSAGTNAHLGAGRYLVAEADESDASFLHLHPVISVVTNIDADHLETYHNDFNALQQAFVKFLHQLPFYGLAILCTDDPVVNQLASALNRPIITYGSNEQADVRLINFEPNGMRSRFTICRANHADLPIELNLPGQHNALNALAAYCVAKELQIEDAVIQQAFAKFSGVGRRLQMHGDFKFAQQNITLLEDYGHHPRELEVTIRALKQAYPERRLVMIFQPHRYTRTHLLFDEFVNVLSNVDPAFLLDIYAANETPITGITSERLVQAINNKNSNQCYYVSDHTKLWDQLAQHLRNDDVVVLQGAGSVGSLAAAFKQVMET